MDEAHLPVGLLELAENKLLYLLGEEVTDQSQRGTLALGSMEEAMEKARAWLESHRAALRQKICRHPVVTMLLENSSLSNKRVILLLSVADLVASIHGGVSPFIVAALLIKQGLTEFCQPDPVP